MKIKPASEMLEDAIQSELELIMDYIERNKINRSVGAVITFSRNKHILEQGGYVLKNRYEPADNIQYIISW